MESILITVKNFLGIEQDFDGFDQDILIGINGALMSLNQIGVGPEAGFVVAGPEDTWTDFLGTATNIEGVKTHICLKTRLLFDPPTNSFLVEAITNQVRELEWRLRLQVEPPATV